MIPQSRPQLLLTRPMAQSQRFAAELDQRFGAVDYILSPLMEPQFLPPPSLPAQDMAQVAGVIFTSETGVTGAARAGFAPGGRGGLAPQTPAYCVGARTAQAAQAQGFAALDAGGDWRDVLALITRHPPKGDLIFCSAAEAAPHLQQAVGEMGLRLHRLDVYQQAPVPMTRDAQAALGAAQPVIVPLFSPRSAALFCTAAANSTAPLWIAALSPPVARAFGLPYGRMAIANRPNSAAMLDALAPWL